MRLVMIGHFKEVRDAKKTKKLIDKISERVNEDPEAYQSEAAPEGRRFTDAMLELLKESKLFNIGPSELEQFTYDASVRIEDSKIIITTDEADVSAFLKILIEKGARVETYSTHDYPDTEQESGH
jgi:hypothetical protein